jgi:nucleoside 2-deoxyribosyltransferase
MKLYLAHPIRYRHVVRRQELRFEERYPSISLINPFYDTGRTDIDLIDKGMLDRYGVDPIIVERDLQLLRSCDGLLAVPCGHESYGTAMEISYAYQYGLPVYVIENTELARHIWIRYHAKRIYRSWEEFINDTSG